MAKKKSKKKSKALPVAAIAVLVVLIVGIIVMFYAMPNGDSLKANLEKKDFDTITDITQTSFLPEGATRQLLMGKMINLQVFHVTITYFDSFGAARDYRDGLDLQDGEKAYMRGKTVIRGDVETAKDVRWIVWA